MDRKERLFKQKDPSKWQCTAVSLDELTARSDSLF